MKKTIRAQALFCLRSTKIWWQNFNKTYLQQKKINFVLPILNKKLPLREVVFGASKGIRTPGLWFRRPTLYPAEL